MQWKASMNRHPRAKWFALAGLAGAVTVGLVVRQNLGEPALVPAFTTLDRGDVVNSVEATGTVDAVTTVNVGCQASGTINRILVDFNSVVKQGQVLATIEDTRYAAAVRQADADLAAARAAERMAEVGVETARADLDAARAELARAQALARKAALDFERNQALFAQQVASTAERDRMKSDYDSAQAAVVAAQALVEQAEARVRNSQALLLQAHAQAKERAGALDVARTNLSYTVIRSPIAGLVVSRGVDVGQTVAARLSAPNLFNIAQNLEHMYVYTKLDVRDVSKVRVGQKATFTVDAFPRMNWEGTVVQVRINPITTQRGQLTPSQLGSAQTTAIPGLQQQASGPASAPTGASPGASATATSTSGVASASGSAPGLAQYDALIEFSNADRRLLPGMTAYVTIPISAAYHVLRVRKEALRASPSISLAEKNRILQAHGIAPDSSVLWIAQGSSFRPAPVTVGETDYVFAEITSGNMAEGQRVLAGYRRPEK